MLLSGLKDVAFRVLFLRCIDRFFMTVVKLKRVRGWCRIYTFFFEVVRPMLTGQVSANMNMFAAASAGHAARRPPEYPPPLPPHNHNKETDVEDRTHDGWRATAAGGDASIVLDRSHAGMQLPVKSVDSKVELRSAGPNILA